MGTETIAREYLHYHFWKSALNLKPYSLTVDFMRKPFGTNNHEALILACNYLNGLLRNDLIAWYGQEHYKLQGPEQGSTTYTPFYLESVLSNYYHACKRNDSLIKALSLKWLNNSYYLWSLGDTKLNGKGYGFLYRRIILPSTRSGYLDGDVVSGFIYSYIEENGIDFRAIPLGITLKDTEHRITALSMLKFLDSHNYIKPKDFTKDPNFGLESPMLFEGYSDGFVSIVSEFKKIIGGPIWFVLCLYNKNFKTIDWGTLDLTWKEAKSWGARPKKIPQIIIPNPFKNKFPASIVEINKPTTTFKEVLRMFEEDSNITINDPPKDKEDLDKTTNDSPKNELEIWNLVLPALIMWAFNNRDPSMQEQKLDGRTCLRIILQHKTSLLYYELELLYRDITGTNIPSNVLDLLRNES